MENKKTIIAIIVVIILIVALVGIAYFYNSFATKQVKLLTEEANKILQSNIATENIDFDIKTEKIIDSLSSKNNLSESKNFELISQNEKLKNEIDQLNQKISNLYNNLLQPLYLFLVFQKDSLI